MGSHDEGICRWGCVMKVSVGGVGLGDEGMCRWGCMIKVCRGEVA